MNHEPSDSNDTTQSTAASTDAAASMLARLRDFAQTLSADERAVLAALLAPGIALAYPPGADAGSDREPEVVGHSVVEWSPNTLPAELARQIRARRLRIEED